MSVSWKRADRSTIMQARLTKSAPSPAEEVTNLLNSETREQEDGLVSLYASSGNQYDHHIYELI